MGPQPTHKSLHDLVKSVPAQTLRTYTLAALARTNATEPSLFPGLARFFATLERPPELHCVRCHWDYLEVENNDHSCCIEHDDEATGIQQGGSEGKEYQVHMACCGKMFGVDDCGETPDGLCFEGRHTTDAMRARLRANANSINDKMASCTKCVELNRACEQRRALAAKRSDDEDNEDDEDDEDDVFDSD